jgi:hypothetical protein
MLILPIEKAARFDRAARSDAILASRVKLPSGSFA